MPHALYLDAARMGKMSPSTQRALQDFVRFLGENGCTLYFDNLLKHGWTAWPTFLRDRFPGLNVWNGIIELRRALSRAVEASEQTSILLAGRTAKLVELAARDVFRRCRRVLITDLTWPSYARVFRRLAKRHGGEIVSVPIRNAILLRKAPPEEIVDHISQVYRAQACDGLFIPEVSHDGIRLPLQTIAKHIRNKSDLTRVVVDGAQAFGQVPVGLSSGFCDLYIVGSHKWLGAYLPLGIGFCPRQESATQIQQTAQMIGDPLLRLLNHMEHGSEDRFAETVNLTPLFSCRAALQDLGNIEARFAWRRSNMAKLIANLPDCWKPILPHEAFRSGILLVKVGQPRLQRVPAEELRALFLSQGIGLTAYADGLVRLSMPDFPLGLSDLQRLANGFSAIAGAFLCFSRDRSTVP